MANSNASLSLRDIFQFLFLKSSTAKASPRAQTIAGKKAKAEKSKKPNKKGAGSVSVIGLGCVVEGNIFFENDVRIDGTLRGDITCQSAIVMGAQCTVFGNVTANDITLEGSFEGKAKVHEIIRVKKTAIINADLFGPSLSAEFGAVLNGACHIGGSEKPKKK